MSRLWWVRHGPTHRRGLVGWSDVPADLSDTEALARLAAFLPEGAPVLSSDLQRCTATAEAIAGARPRLGALPGLREINFGAWELCTADEISASDPDLARAYWDDPLRHAPPGGETLAEVNRRVDAALAPFTGLPDLIVVAHFGVIIGQLHKAWGRPIRETLAQKIDNLSVTEIGQDGGRWRVGCVNLRP